MEEVYIKGRANQPTSWCSSHVTFKDYFAKYSRQLSGVYPHPKLTTRDIFHRILPETELSNESFKNLIKLTDKNQFKTVRNKKIPEETIQPSTSKESIPSTSKENNHSTSEKDIPIVSKEQSKAVSRGLVNPTRLKTIALNKKTLGGTIKPSSSKDSIPSTSKKNNQSTLGKGILSLTKEQDKVPSRGWTEAVIASSSAKGTENKSAGENSPDCFTQSNTVVKKKQTKRNKKKTANRDTNNQEAISSEAVEVGRQLLESMNLNSETKLSIDNPHTSEECLDLQCNTSAKIENKAVDCQPMEESITNTDNMSVGTATSSIEPTNDQEVKISTISKNPDTNKVPRRSTRSKKKRGISEAPISNEEMKQKEEVQNATANYNITSSKDQQETSIDDAEGNSEPCSFKDIISEITKRGGRNKQRNITIRGQILVDTTKRLGKKDLIPRENFVVSFRIHKPFHRNIGQKGVRPGKSLQEIDVLNYQTLADLREKIVCEGDFQDTAGDVSNWPYAPVTTLSKDKYKSGMFYIGNTFYVDTQEGADDYSVVIRKWAEDHFIKVGETKPMDQMKVEDLMGVRLGYPYVYMHQGSCEHLIIISDARLLTEKKSLHSSDYPNITKTTRSLVYYCIYCMKKPADWVVTGSDRMIHDINFMCKGCFQSYHYINDKKVGNFKAYRWKQRAILFH